jgi:hypothetical protein
METAEMGFVAVQDNEWRTINLTILKKNWMADISTNKQKIRGLSPQVNYTDRATAACRRS